MFPGVIVAGCRSSRTAGLRHLMPPVTLTHTYTHTHSSSDYLQSSSCFQKRTCFWINVSGRRWCKQLEVSGLKNLSLLIERVTGSGFNSLSIGPVCWPMSHGGRTSVCDEAVFLWWQSSSSSQLHQLQQQHCVQLPSRVGRFMLMSSWRFVWYNVALLFF